MARGRLVRQDRAVATVVQISDTHLTIDPDPRAAPPSPDGCLDLVLVALGDVRPDVVVLTGDIADDGSREACERVRDKVVRLGGVLVATSGNHDDPEAVAVTFGARSAIDIGAWRLELFDTSVPGRIDGALDVAAAIARIDAAAPRPTFVALHHPPRSPSTNPDFRLAGADELVDAVVTRPHVRVVVSGHLHESFERAAAHVRFVGAPSTWYALAHDGPDYRHAADGAVGAHVYELDEDGSFTWRLVRR
jgi:3',5'-cyclic-AMP phosphodiesterase